MSKKDYNLFKPRKDSSYDIIDLNKGNIDPNTILGIRARHYNKDVFFKTPIFDTISQKILNDTFTFITGNPLAGKTRVVYDTLSLLKNKVIIIPKAEEWIKEYHLPFRNDLIIFIDELDVFCDKNPVAINKLLHFANANNIKCVITCRTGPEFFIVKSILNHHIFLELIRNKIHIPRVNKEDEKFKEFVNTHQAKLTDPTNFDGNMGSLILPLVDMRKRFQLLDENKNGLAIAILQGLKLHYHLYNYESKKSYYDESKIRLFCKKHLQDEATNVEWENAKKQILSTETNLNFIDENDYIIIEEAYLDCHEDSAKDVVDDSLNVNKIKRIFKDLYKDPYESKALGFPTSINDWNSVIEKEENYEEAFKIFTHLSEGVKPTKYTFTLLMKKTQDKEKLDFLFSELRRRKLDSRNAPNSIYFGRANDFKELLESIAKSSKGHLKFRTNVSDKLIKLSKENPKENLEYLFKKYPKDHIFGNHVFIQICMKCCRDFDDYKNYVEPYIPKAHLLETNLFKTFIRLCSMLKQKDVAVGLLDKYFSQDRFDYCNEKANCIKDEQPLDALELYEEAAKSTTNFRQIAKSYTNYGQLVYDKHLNTKLHAAIENCYKGIKESKIQHSEFPYLRHVLLLLIIRQTPIEDLINKVELLMTRPDIKKGTFLHIFDKIDNIDKQNILTSFFNSAAPTTE